MKRMRIPFLVSVDERLYVHYTGLSQKAAMAAYRGNHANLFGQIEEEIRECDPNGEVVVHGTCAWGGKDVEDLGTISLSEFGLSRSQIKKPSKSQSR